MKFATVAKMAIAAILVVVVALIAAGKSLDSNAYKAFLSERIKASTGLDLGFSGPIKLKLGLAPQLSFTGLSLSNPHTPKAPPLLFVDRIEARVALMPLIFRQLQLEQMVLIRPTLRLEQIPASGKAADGEPVKPLDLGQPPAKIAITRLALGEVRVEDAVVLWRATPKAPESRLLVGKARVQPDLLVGGPMSIQAEGNWDGSDFDLAGIVGSPHVLMAGSKPYPVQIKGAIDGAVVVIKGNIAEPLAVKGIDIAISAQGDELAELVKRLNLPAAESPLPAIGPYKLSARLTDTGGTLGLAEIDAVLGKRDAVLLNLKGTIRALAPLSGVDLAVLAEAEGLSGVSRLLALDLPGAGPLKLSARLTEAESGWRLAGIKSTLGHSDFAGELALATYPRPRLFGRLASQTLVPGDFSLPQTRSATDPTRAQPQRPSIAVADGRVLGLTPLGFEAINAFDLDLSLAATRLQLGPLALGDATGEIHMGGAKLVVQAFTARLGDGKLQGQGRIDLSGRSPSLALKLGGTGLDLGHLGIEGLSGHAEFSLDAHSQGANPRALAGSLDGAFTAGLSDAALATSDPDSLAHRLLRALDPQGEASPGLASRCTQVRLAAKGGLISADRGLTSETAQGTIAGAGTIDLRTEAIELAFTGRNGAWTRIKGMLGAPVLVNDGTPPRLTTPPSGCGAPPARRR